MTIFPIDSPSAKLNNAGGKGANLSRLIRAGFQVPAGFIITTEVYLAYVTENSLSERIKHLISGIDPQDTQQLHQISQQIRERFTAGHMPPGIEEQIQAAYEKLANKSVAVRSSATAEDLPGLSFAGQQDTYLNIINFPDLMQAIVSCWSSLWTARAIGYRTRIQLPYDGIAQAVVVQEMVPSEISGVMFTANPISGSRRESVIDATLGVGETLVSGQVEPDHFLVDTNNMQLIDRKIGSKSISMVPDHGGGLEIKRNKENRRQAISDESILELAAIGQRITRVFDYPQDIEWAIYNEQIFLLQSRPITSLYPLPEGVPPKPLQALFSFGAVQGILEPFTPLGQDAIRLIFAGGASLFGLTLSHTSQPVIKAAGERLWGNVTPVLQNPLGARLLPRVFSAVDPSLQKILATLRNDPEIKYGEGRVRFSTVRRLIAFAIPTLRRVFHYAWKPRGVADEIQRGSENEIARLRKKYEKSTTDSESFQDTVDLFREIYNAFPYAIPKIATAAAGGLIPFFLLNKISEQLTGSNQLSLEVSRGLPHNVTTEMDLELWHAATSIRADPQATLYMIERDPQTLARDYQAGQLPATAQSAVSGFLGKYGVRGLGEIDIGRKRWREDPHYIFDVILRYLQIQDAAQAPDAIFQKGVQIAEQAGAELSSIARRSFAGGIKSRLIGWLVLRIRELVGLRETPKFHIIQMMGIIRQGLLASGQVLTKQGVVEQADDLFYLYLDELQLLAEGDRRNWKEIITQRREKYQHELYRAQVPRLILSDGRTFYEGLTVDGEDKGKLIGSPVSPGVIEGKVRVVLDPLNAGLQAGEIMVCRGTDPAWTPLFMTAGGLIMEVGGMMTHGAIVAREYGIPAVVGLDQATTVLKTGQRIQLNGTIGEVLLIDQQ
jgi:pyruvate,water dikinase